jgi:hypothetical protein
MTNWCVRYEQSILGCVVYFIVCLWADVELGKHWYDGFYETTETKEKLTDELLSKLAIEYINVYKQAMYNKRSAMQIDLQNPSNLVKSFSKKNDR